MRLLPIFPLLLVACPPAADTAGDSADGTDLAERLDAAEVRAGVVTDVAALFGGISSEGAPGDVKIYNDRVRFIIDAVGDSNYYVDYGGGVIDADLVRPDGQPGRDLLDELTPMVSLGRIVDATSVEVLEDGADGVATVRVSGRGAPLRLVTGAVENPGLVPDFDVRIVTDYTLRPGAWSLEAVTTVYNDDTTDFVATIGMLAVVAQEVASFWRPGTGFDDTAGGSHAMEALVGARNEGVLALMAGSGELDPSVLGDVISGIAAGMTAFGPSEVVAPGASASWTTRIGVAPDLATLEAERLDREGVDPQTVTGVVRAGGSALAGARVHVLDDDGAPLTVAVTGADGSWSAPGKGASRYVATGRGSGELYDLPDGHGNVSPYDRSRDEVLGSLAVGALPIAFADGYGVGAASTESELSLDAPGFLHLQVSDLGPATALLDFALADPVTADERLVPGRPSGHAANIFLRDGDITVAVEPGDYRLTVHRGAQYELATVDVTVRSGETTEASVDLARSYTPTGWVSFDPHAHASPSGDGGIPMEERLIVTAAAGVDVHVGTDHDHVADYRPALSALGLDGWLHSIVADEVSPVMRGHFNAYPAVQTGRANGGAPRWWQGVESTDWLFQQIRGIVGDEGIIQANHPVSSSGMFSMADYSPSTGIVADGNRWSDDFDAMEVLNSDDWTSYFAYYLDLDARGKSVTPVGVSDSHTARGGTPGLNFTFLHTGGNLASFGPDVLKTTMAERATVVSHGPFIDATIGGAPAPGTTVEPGTLDVVVYAPSWIPVDAVKLWQNGVEVGGFACEGSAPTQCTGAFDLTSAGFGAEMDGSYVVTAEGLTRPITQVWTGHYAWAMTSALHVDVGGDGWTAPKAALIIE